MKKRKILLLALVSLTFSCSGGSVRRNPSATGDAPTHGEVIQNEQEFDEFATDGDGLVSGGKSLKFLIDNRGPKPVIHFINSNFREAGQSEPPEYVKYHYYFANHELGVTLSLDQFNQETYFNNRLDRKFTAGTIQTYKINQQGKETLYYGIQFYPQDLIAEQLILRAVQTVTASFHIAGAPMAFVAYGVQQTYRTITAPLQQLKITPFTVDQILGSTSYLPLNVGEAWGYLKVFPKPTDELGPDSIPLFNDLPLDLSVVSGTITYSVQTPSSHINLKSKERGTPNMVLRDSTEIQKLKAEKDGRPVHLVVARDHFTIEDSDDATLKAKLRAKLPTHWQKIPLVDDTSLRKYDDMCTTTPSKCLSMSSSYGGKSAKLGFLASKGVIGAGSAKAKSLGYRLSPMGFGIPLKFYADFVNSNPALKAKLQTLFTREMGVGRKSSPITSVERAQFSKDIQQLFYKGVFPKADLDAILAAAGTMKSEVENAYPGIQLKKIKIRSSANVEDIPDFDGAGLHDSFSAKLSADSSADQACALIEDAGDGDVDTKSKMQPASIACAIKGVYGSLWNLRAIEERSYKGIDHSTARMGISVLPAYDFRKDQGYDISANSVLVTRVINSKGVFGYTASNQVGDNLVTNPDPGTHAEVSIISYVGDSSPVSVTVLQHAQPQANAGELDHEVMDQKTLLTLASVGREVEEAYCRSKPDYYPSGDCTYVTYDSSKKTSLDMEYKILGSGANAQVFCKQVREFSGD